MDNKPYSDTRRQRTTNRNDLRDEKQVPLNNERRPRNDEYVPRGEPRQRKSHDFVSDMAPVGETEWALRNRKKIIIGLIAVGAIAAAVGIGELISNYGKVRIVNVQPAVVAAQQPYQACHNVGTTSYSRNHKSGTEGAIIGGVGGAAVGGLITHSWVGAGVGAAVGAVGGDLIERSNQPDYVAHHGSTTQCETAYRPIQVPVGYQVEYMDSDDKVTQIITQHQPPVGGKVPLEQLQADQVTQEQQQLIVQQAVNGGGAIPPAQAGTQAAPAAAAGGSSVQQPQQAIQQSAPAPQ